MRSLLFIILAGYAVKCDDTSYYLIEMLDVTMSDARPFQVYWNVPTMQCRSKKIPFENLYEKFGIIQNKDDSFRGEKVAILYDPGLFPALLKNETSGKFVFRNGGVPQEGDLEKHLAAFKSVVEQSIPDPDFSGVGIIDFESWRPVFRQNWGVLVPYKDVSYQIERKLHWFWTEKAIQARARQRFEESARVFMQTTLSLAKKMRPRALWGYYGFPYCFNMASNNMVENCSDNIKQENDRTYWLWSESTALFPSVYSSKDLSTLQLAGLIRGRLKEAVRDRRKNALVLPYFWFRYREGGYLSQNDLDTALATMYKSNASGFMIWGSSSDVNTAEKCNELLKYTNEILGPAIAKYTKAQQKNVILRATRNSTVTSDEGITTFKPILKDISNDNTTKKNNDPDFHWDPPENYTQDIVHYVEQEWKKKQINNTEHNNEILVNVKQYTLFDFIINLFKHNKETIENSTNTGTKSDWDNGTTMSSLSSNAEYHKIEQQLVENSTSAINSLSTQNPLHTLSKNEEKESYPTVFDLIHDNMQSVKLDSYLGSITSKDDKKSSTNSPYTTKSYTIQIGNQENTPGKSQNLNNLVTHSFKSQEFLTSETTTMKDQINKTKNIHDTHVPYTLTSIVEDTTEIYLDSISEKHNDTDNNLILSTETSLLENINVYDITTSYLSEAINLQRATETPNEENTNKDEQYTTTESSLEFNYEDFIVSKNEKKQYDIKDTDYETDSTSTEIYTKSQIYTETYTDKDRIHELAFTNPSTEDYNIADINTSLEPNTSLQQGYFTFTNNSTSMLISDDKLEEGLISVEQEEIAKDLSTKNSDSTTESLEFTKDEVPDSFNEEYDETSVFDEETSTSSPSQQVVVSV